MITGESRPVPKGAGARVVAHGDRRVGRHRAHDACTRSLRDRPRLAGDHRLVELGFALHDRPVGGNARARTHEHDVADAQRRNRYRRRSSVGVDAFGLVGEELGQRGQRRARLPERLHLEPVAEQHDRDEGGELPPELEIEHPRLVASDATYATVIAMAMSSIIPGWRRRSSARAPSRNGQPAQKKTNEPSSGPIQSMPAKSRS